MDFRSMHSELDLRSLNSKDVLYYKGSGIHADYSSLKWITWVEPPNRFVLKVAGGQTNTHDLAQRLPQFTSRKNNPEKQYENLNISET
jgi:hypothetical protein